MKQIIQNYKSGELQLVEVPAPQVRPGGGFNQNQKLCGECGNRLGLKNVLFIPTQPGGKPGTTCRGAAEIV